MAQADYVVANGTGAAVRSDLNGQLAAIVSNNSGATEPATMYAYQWWADTTTGLLKLRNSANSAWVTIRQLDGEFSTVPVENGTAAAPSIYFKDSGTDSGFFSPGTNAVAISTAGANRLHVTSAGLVGIGTSSPGAPLHVVGASGSGGIQIGNSADTQYHYINFGGATSSDNAWQIGRSPTGGVGPANGFYIYDLQNSLTRLSIDASGRVGVGTASPSRQLDVNSTAIFDSNGNGTTTSPSLAIGSSGVGFSYIGSQQLAFITNSTEKVRLTSDGKLLVGTSTSTSATVNGLVGKTQIASSENAALALHGHSSSALYGADIVFTRSRSATIGTNTIVQNGDEFGRIYFTGANGTGFDYGASIQAVVDGTPGASNNMPGRLVFSTTPSGSASPTEQMRLDNAGNLKFNSGYGSAATAYGCRAWVNFDGTGTVAIRASGNVSSITDHGPGDYTVNFTTAMPDANYAAAVTGTFTNGGLYVEGATAPTTANLRVKSYNSAGTPVDVLYANVAIFR
jgi:hypothetical protein